MKISKLLLFVDGLCNVLILKWYVIAAKKAKRMHIEGRKNAGMLFLMCECVSEFGNAVINVYVE